MSLSVATVRPSKRVPLEAAGPHEELVRRVASSTTFEKSPRLRAFLSHVCRCALECKPEEATEQQIGIYVYGRSPGYNPNDDNIVRSQARVLRMKLEHHFANEGKDEPVIITIPKGQYLPILEPRFEEPRVERPVVLPVKRERRWGRWLFPGIAILVGLLLIWLGKFAFKPRTINSTLAAIPAAPFSADVRPDLGKQLKNDQVALLSDSRDIRIAAGHTGAPQLDKWGHRWSADRYFEGGIVQPGPRHFFPPVPDEVLFNSLREAASDDNMVPQPEHGFQYNIPLSPGVYELRLYFADPLRQPDIDQKEDAQNRRHFEIDANGKPILPDIDPIADAGFAATDVRVFKDIRPAADGKLHLDFHSHWGGSFVSAIEITPGTPGRLKPIRIAARPSDFEDANGTWWSGDNYFIDGRTWFYPNPEKGPKVPALYAGERHGNFSYAIPVAPGSYTVRLHFLESFFSPLIPAATCQGVGCRVFDVTCNGVLLLQDFDITQAAGGAFRPLIREFHGLHPNGQGKLLLSFSSKTNYAEIRAIEVIDETK